MTAPSDSFFEKVRDSDREAAREFYKKYMDVKGIPVVAAAEVADLALQRTYDIVTHMLAGRPDVLKAMVDQGMYLVIIGRDQVYTDLPENRNARNADYLNERVRGTGGLPTSFGEENLLSLPIDRYDDESIAVHEFCHTIDGTLGRIDPTWRQRKNAVYRNAVAKGLFKDTYAGSNSAEYWAECVQAYFDCNRINNWNHGPIGKREQLKIYDPEGYELVRTTFNLGPDQDWRYSFLQTQPSVTAPPAKFHIDPYYTKFTWAREFTVLGREASDEAMLKANDTIRKMFAYRHDILKALIADGVKLVVLGPDEKISDLPEGDRGQGTGDRGQKLNAERCTLNAGPEGRFLDYSPDTPASAGASLSPRKRGLLVVGQENVLANPTDPYATGCQVIRAFAKALYYVTGTRPVDPNWDSRPRGMWQQYELQLQRMDIRFDEKLAAIYQSAMSKGLWKGTAAVHNRIEYWAEGVLAYFDAAGTGAPPNDADHPITTRERLLEYDPHLFAFVEETMAYKGKVDWRYQQACRDSSTGFETRYEARQRRTKLAPGMLIGTGAGKASDLPTENQTLNAPQVSPQERFSRSRRVEGYYKGQITPHWFVHRTPDGADNTRFWYRNDLSGDTKEFILVNAEQGTRQPAFDHQKLASALSKATGVEYQADKLPFENIEFVNDGSAIQFAVGNTTWACDLKSYTCSKSDAAEAQPSADQVEQSLAPFSPRTCAGGKPCPQVAGLNKNSVEGSRFGRRRGPGQRPGQSADSPDGAWTAFVKDHNVFVRARDNNEDIQLSTDGAEGNAYGVLSWAPDSNILVAYRIEPGDKKEVYLIESSPPRLLGEDKSGGGGRARLHTRSYDLPGDKLPRYELNLFDVEQLSQTKPEIDRFEHGWERPRLHWSRDGRYLSYEQVDRGHQRLRVIQVDAQTGQTRNLIDEKSETFLWTAHTENLRLNRVNWLDKTDEIIYASEMDGWRHLYLVDAPLPRVAGLISPRPRSGGNQITSGQWVVRGIDLIDEDARQVWFHAGGMNPDQDPYFIHYYRINFDGSDLVALTEGNGNHSIQYSPDRKYIIDTYSRVDMAPIHELRRASDGNPRFRGDISPRLSAGVPRPVAGAKAPAEAGAMVCPLEKADISELIADGWMAPQVFVAKGRDGKPDIWGIICRPRDFDPDRKYPVIEQIYAGPQSAYVPKSFSPVRRFAQLTDLGFIVVQVDGMGTANRSKAFHDVCWKNLKDAGFPDRILWHQAVAKKYPYYDISRVGVYGNSAGGQNAAGAVLFHPELYKVAVASCGCHDNRMDKASWNEQWMGYPVGPQYAESSNIDNAHRLRGKLFLIVGEMDNNVPPESTMRFVDALIKAGKDFDLLVIPGAGHGMGGSYGQRRMQDFFVRHLLAPLETQTLSDLKNL